MKRFAYFDCFNECFYTKEEDARKALEGDNRIIKFVEAPDPQDAHKAQEVVAQLNSVINDGSTFLVTLSPTELLKEAIRLLEQAYEQ